MPDPNREAAKILRGLKERVDRVESAVSEAGIPNLYRRVTDRVGIDDPFYARYFDAEVIDTARLTDTYFARFFDADVSDQLNATDDFLARFWDANVTDTGQIGDTLTVTAYEGGTFTADQSQTDSQDLIG